MQDRLTARVPRPRIGLLPTGHEIYWGQFPGLREKCLHMLDCFQKKLGALGTVVSAPLVDTPEKAWAAGQFSRREKVDIVLIFPLGYTTGMVMMPAVRSLTMPLRILNAHLDAKYDYKTADTAEYLYHEGPCCIPEYAGTLVHHDIPFDIRSGWIGDERLWHELAADCRGAAAARAFRELKVGVIGNTYTNMTDMPTDDHRVLRATGRDDCSPRSGGGRKRLSSRHRGPIAGHVSPVPRDVPKSIRRSPTSTCKESAQLAVAYDQVVCKHDISASAIIGGARSPC